MADSLPLLGELNSYKCLQKSKQNKIFEEKIERKSNNVKLLIVIKLQRTVSYCKEQRVLGAYLT